MPFALTVSHLFAIKMRFAGAWDKIADAVNAGGGSNSVPWSVSRRDSPSEKATLVT
jgi:hypothetical protein